MKYIYRPKHGDRKPNVMRAETIYKNSRRAHEERCGNYIKYGFAP